MNDCVHQEASATLGCGSCSFKIGKREDSKPLLGLHSLQAGGATAAANAGVPDQLYKRHGRWRSESAKDRYIKDSQQTLLWVTESLKL